MKLRIISLSLSLFFLFIVTFEYLSAVVVVENSSSSNTEYTMEKRLVDKFIDDVYLLSADMVFCNYTSKPLIAQFQKKIYTFKLINNLFKPPIYV